MYRVPIKYTQHSTLQVVNMGVMLFTKRCHKLVDSAAWQMSKPVSR